MCGIVGIVGTRPVAEQIVEALKRLEYRGYDSAGVATLDDGRLDRRRAEGKLRNLEAKLADSPLPGLIGIGHTRWATHGKPNETNAHPHATDKLAVVHNGIIENFRELKTGLEAKGVRFQTETDTEVVAQLVTWEMHQGRGPIEAVAVTLPRLRGAFALGFHLRRRGRPDDRRPPWRAPRDRLRFGEKAILVPMPWRSRLSQTRSHIWKTAIGRSSRVRTSTFATIPVKWCTGPATRSPPARISPTRAITAISWRRKSTNSRK